MGQFMRIRKIEYTTEQDEQDGIGGLIQWAVEYMDDEREHYQQVFVDSNHEIVAKVARGFLVREMGFNEGEAYDIVCEDGGYQSHCGWSEPVSVEIL